MKNLSKLSILFIFLLFFISSTTFAEVPKVPKVAIPATQAIILADVNIREAKIISQDGNNFKISFSLSNGQGLQTGVKYGIELISGTSNSKTLVDEKVYEESLSLKENSTVKKEITYVAPKALDGVYKMYVTSKNESGFPFSSGFLGDVRLTSSLEGIQIIPESCRLSVVGEKTSIDYGINQIAYVSPKENLNLTCIAVNNSGNTVEAVPQITTKEGTLYGKEVVNAEQNIEPIKFITKERKIFSIVISKPVVPKFYHITLGLKSGDTLSNTISASYIVNGVIANIDNLLVDKDNYKKGDTANLSLIWTYLYTGSNTSLSKGKVDPTVLLGISVKDNKGKDCAETYSQSLTKDFSKPKTEIPISITKSCSNPKVLVTLKDSSGNILDQKEYKTQSTTPVNFFTKKVVYIIVLLVILILGIIIYKKRKGNMPNISNIQNSPSSIPMSVILPFLFMITLFSIIPINKTSAATFSVTSDNGNCSSLVSVSLDKSAYTTNDIIIATGSMSNASCIPPYGPVYSQGITASSSTGSGTVTVVSGAYANSVNFYTPAYGGSGQITFTAFLNASSVQSGITYSVNVPADPALNVWADSNSIVSGSQAHINWTSSNTTSCNVIINGSQYGAAGTATSGSFYHTPSSDTTYAVACYGSTNITRQTTVYVTAPPIPTVDVNAYNNTNFSSPTLLLKNASNVTTQGIAPKTPVLLKWEAIGFNNTNIICTLPDGITKTPIGKSFGDYTPSAPISTSTYSVSCTDNSSSGSPSSSCLSSFPSSQLYSSNLPSTQYPLGLGSTVCANKPDAGTCNSFTASPGGQDPIQNVCYWQ